MNPDLAVVLGILGVAVLLFVIGRPRPDAVALIVIVVLPLSGTISYREAIEGFANPNLILIACLFVIGEGLVRTGVAQAVGDWLLHKGGTNEQRLIVLVMGAVAAMGSVMSSTAVVAIFIPIILRIAQRTAISSRQVLYPMGAAAAISGMMTLVATTSNLVLNSALIYAGHEGFGFFAFTPIGLLVAAVAIPYLLAARRGLPADSPRAPQSRRPSLAGWVDKYALHDRAYRLHIDAGSDLAGVRLARCHEALGAQACVIAIERHARFGRAVLEATDDGVLETGDVLLLDVDDASFPIGEYCRQHGLRILPMNGAYFSDQSRDVGMAEVIIPPDSRLVGASVRASPLLRRHGLFVVGVWRNGASQQAVHRLSLRAGDTALVVGPWKGIFALQSVEHDVISLALPVETDAVVAVPGRAPAALLALVCTVALMLTGWVPNVIAGLIGCLLMGLFGCITLDIAYRAINWRALILIIGMLPFAIALEHTGGVDLAAQQLLAWSGGWGVRGQLALLFAATIALGTVVSGTATAVLMGPVAIGLAEALHADPHPYVMAVAIACSAAFMSPVSTPSNALVSVAGGFRFVDYLKVGTPLMLMTLGVSIMVIPIMFGG
ncbi:SLC13 family permease [Pseudomonadota bacterium AL_CKDN230030165-1A_HGKHYDSX7]